MTNHPLLIIFTERVQGLKFTLGSHIGCIYKPEHQKILFPFKENATEEDGRKEKDKWERRVTS